MKSLPYPKLQKNRPDYETSLINCDLASHESGMDLVLRGEFQLFDEELEKLLQEGNISYCLIIKCDATNRSDIYYINESEKKFMLRISKSQYADKVVIIPGIITKEEITGYINENLAEDYRNSDITLPKNALIAECESYELTIYRYSEQNTESVCRFRKGRLYRYKINKDYIEITVPDEIFTQYCKLKIKDCAQIFTSMYVVPVIQQVIQDYWIDEPNSDEVKSDRWYVALDERIKISIDLTKSPSAFEITMNILEGLIFESTGFLVKYYGGSINDY